MESIPLNQTQVQVRVNEFVRSVYNWMAIGLALTGFMAYYVAHSEPVLSLLFQVVDNQLRPTMLFYGLIIAELVMVFALSGCTAMLVSGSAESEKPSDCTESEKEAEKRGC